MKRYLMAAVLVLCLLLSSCGENGEPVVQGTVKMAINITSQSVQDNINYNQAAYIGLTYAPVSDTYVIQYGDKKLKVLYVNTLGRYNQVFMGDYNG